MIRTDINANQVKRWAKEHIDLALALCQAMAFAEIKRKQVDAYILPVFQRFHFTADIDNGQPITRPKDLYLSSDETQCAAYYAACDKAHREHGFTGEEGHCPALIAENLVIETENALIAAAEPLFGIEVHHLWKMEDRRKYLDLLVGACLKTAKAA